MQSDKTAMVETDVPEQVHGQEPGQVYEQDLLRISRKVTIL